MKIPIGFGILYMVALTASAADKPATESKPNIVYVLAADIGERNNLATKKPEKVAELQSRLKMFLQSSVPPGGDAGGEDAVPKRSKRSSQEGDRL